MKKSIKFLTVYLLILFFNLAMTSCGNDEPDKPDNPTPPPTIDNPDNKDDNEDDDEKPDPTMYEIVGKWKTKTSSYSNVLEVDKNGYFSYNLSDNYYGELTGVGTWTYDSSKKTWDLKCSGSWGGPHARINGTYTKIGNNLYYEQTVIYTPSEGDMDEPVSISDDSRIFGTWKGTYYGDPVELEFKEDGHLIEKWDGEYNVTMFTLKNGKMTLDEELGTILSNTLYSTFSCSFLTNTKIKLYTDFDSITLTKK